MPKSSLPMKYDNPKEREVGLKFCLLFYVVKNDK